MDYAGEKSAACAKAISCSGLAAPKAAHAVCLAAGGLEAGKCTCQS
jgi:hypothetical protein